MVGNVGNVRNASEEVRSKVWAMTYAVTLEKNVIACSITMAKGMRHCRDASGCRTRFSLLLKCCLNTGKEMVSQL